MYQETPELLTCEIGFRPRSQSSSNRIQEIVAHAGETTATSAGWRFSGDKLLITGNGFDGRCALCREIRRRAKAEELLFSVRCKFERDDQYAWRVIVGSSAFDITLLENEALYRRRKRDNPLDVLVRTHLGVIAEARGEFAQALVEYLAVLKLCPQDRFTQRRIREVSGKLIEQKRVQHISHKALELIASS